MFNFGWGELVVIGIVALIAIGPKELPTVLRTLGQALAKVRRMAAEFQGQFQEALREAEITDLKKQAEEFTGDITRFDPMADTQKEMERAFEMPDPMQDAPAAADAAAPAETAAAPAADAKSQLPEIDVALPEQPAPVTEKDFAPAEPPPPPKKSRKKKPAGGSV